MASGEDRISKAWALRNALHTWLKGEGVATVVEAFAAFPTYHQETVRKALQRMRKDGDVMMTGRRGMVGTFRTVTQQISPEAQKRQRLADGARITHAKNKARTECDRFEASHRMRVTILAHMASGHDGETAKQIADGLKVKHDMAYRNLRRMVEEDVLVLSKRGKDLCYFATGKPLTSADEMRQRTIEKKAKSTAEYESKRQTRGRTGVYIHQPDKPIPNQGGQGATTRGFGIQSCADFIF